MSKIIETVIKDLEIAARRIIIHADNLRKIDKSYSSLDPIEVAKSINQDANQIIIQSRTLKRQFERQASSDEFGLMPATNCPPTPACKPPKAGGGEL